MIGVVPGVVNVDGVPAGVVSISKQRMTRNVNEHRPAGVYLGLELLEREPSRQVALDLTLDVLREVRDHSIAAEFRVQSHTIGAVPVCRIASPVVERRGGGTIVEPEGRGAVDIAVLGLAAPHEIRSRIR